MAVSMREMGRLDESFDHFQRAGRELVEEQNRSRMRRQRRSMFAAAMKNAVNMFNPYAATSHGTALTNVSC